MTTRRLFLGACAGLALAPALAAMPRRPVRVGLTPVFLGDQHGLLADWRAYMEAKLQQPVVFVQRDSYRETMDLLRLEQIDFAWICDYPFVYLRKQVRLLAVPRFKGRPYYRAYLIVPARMLAVTSLLDLRNKIFAYADPYSNTGYLAPRYQLRQLGEDPGKFFKRTFFTYSHHSLIEAVADGLADGGSVDSYVWDALSKIRADITGRTRIVSQSPEYGFPPFVANHAVSAESFQSMQKMLLTMADDGAGKVLLERLDLDGFVVGDARNYELVARMMREFGEE
ncbi:MAG TPA: PhnD/SsuA/transferrin family substrate-binding protein [Rhodocyclaceae bacterium]|nr:PhnD/SsuA/transferrin family substrate-binding protein [Rhodocyclaceae bacterium]